MAKRPSLTSKEVIVPVQKKTRQGISKNTKLSASSRNFAKKKYRGQGK